MASADSSQSVYVTIILTPNPGQLEGLYDYAVTGAQYQEKNEPNCLSWVASKAMDPMKLLQGASEEVALEGVLIVHQEWRSLEAYIAHGKTEYAAKTRETLQPLLSERPILKVGKKFAGFTSR